MNYRARIPLAACLSFACALSGCRLNEEYNTQSFDAGGATCLAGKQLYFGYPPGLEKSAPWPYYPRFVIARTTLPVESAGHVAVDFSQADPFELTLPEGVEFGYYGRPFDTMYLGSDGTIALGTPGTGNSNLADAFSSDQISLLPVDATVAGAAVRYAIVDGRIVITYENVQGSTFQCELFFEGEQQNAIAVTYTTVSENTLAGVVGIPDRFHGAIAGSQSIELFLLRRFVESNLCENSPLNRNG